MPVTDVRVLLRVASSDSLRPRVRQGSAVAVEATVIDQDKAPIAGAIVTLRVRTPFAVLEVAGVVADAAGIASAVIALPDAGEHLASAIVTSPQAEVVERVFDVIAAAVTFDDEGAVLVTDQGEFIVLSNGQALGG